MGDFNRIIVLSIKPKFAEAILSGVKKWEYRRTPPNIEESTPMALYATEETKAIVGVCQVTKLLRKPLDSLIELTLNETTSTREGLTEYFKGIDLCSALRVESPVRIEIGFAQIKELMPSFIAPQNFYYLKKEEEQHRRLLTLLESKLPDTFRRQSRINSF